jgi:predicted dehydrogenase
MNSGTAPDVKNDPLIPKVRLALVGLRYGAAIAREIIRHHNPWIEIVALCDRDEKRARQISAELGVPLVEWKALLSDPTVEAVGLFTGPVGRAGLIREIIRSGKDVLTTKPFELDPVAAREILIEADRLGRIIHLNSPGPVPAEDVRQILAWQEEHQLGRPVAMRAETWTSYREKANGSWYDDTAVCGPAPLIRLGIYFLNEFASLMGEPESVHVFQSRIFTERPTSDNAQAGIRFRNGALGHIFASFCVQDGRPYRDDVTLNYENGTIRRWLDCRAKVRLGGQRAVTELCLAKSEQVIRSETAPGQWCGWYQWESFQKAIRQRQVPSESERHQMLYGVRLLEAIGRSYRSGHAESVLTEPDLKTVAGNPTLAERRRLLA